MRTIIAGSRTIIDYHILQEVMKYLSWKPSVILSGHASGVDTLGEIWAKENNIPLEICLADWKNEGRRAGFIRNEKMVDNAEALVAIWDGKSKGTENTIMLARKKGIHCYIKITEQE